MTGRQSSDIEYHSQDQRKNYRLTTPFWVSIEDKTYRTKDWSTGGLAITDFHREVHIGEVLDLKIIIKFQGFNIGFDAKAKAIGTNNNKIRFKFENLDERSRNILEFFSHSIISGEMVDAEDAIKRLDTPINFQEQNISDMKSKRGPLHRWPLKSLLFTAFYLTAGLALFFYIILLIYSNFVHMKVESAVVSSETESLVSPFDGNIDLVYVNKGDFVKNDQPLIKIRDYNLEHLLDVEKTNFAEAKAGHALQANIFELEKNKLKIYENIGATRHNEAQANLDALEQRLQQVTNDYKRALALFKKKFISKAEMDKYTAEFQVVNNQVRAAETMLKERDESLVALRRGHYFSQERLEGDMPMEDAKLRQSEKQIGVTQKRIAALEEQIEDRVIHAPFQGHIVGVFKSRGNTVSRGDNLVLLERNSYRFITAYLTQDEVVEVKINGTVSVYIPSIKKRYNGRVTSIDRTTGFIDEVKSTYRPRTIQDRSAIVNIELPDFNQTSLSKQLLPGTPAVVYFDRSLVQGIAHRFSMYFESADKPVKDTKNSSSNTQPAKEKNNL